MALTLTYKLRKFKPYAAHCVNEYVKEKEEKENNMTTLVIYHWVLLVTMGDHLWNDILL